MRAATNPDPVVDPDPMGAAARAYFAIVGGIGLVTGVTLLGASGATADYFAWPIAPPQTALFMGAGYLGTGITLFILLFFGRFWLDVRLIVPPVAVFACAMIGATLLHVDKFLWDRSVTWLWIGLYGAILAGAAALALTHRGRLRPAWSGPLTTGERAALIVVGLLTAAWALPLYVAPSLGAVIWPWPLTPLTARVVAGWVAVAATLGVAGGVANDARSIRLPLLGWTITVVALLVVSALGVPATGDTRALVYFSGLALSVVGSVWLLARVQRRLGQAGSPR